VTVCDARAVGVAQRAVQGLFGEQGWKTMDSPIMGAEDFSYVLERIPGAMVFLGVRPGDGGVVAPCHSNRMILNEDGMAAGIALHAAFALRTLGAEPRAS
jgi:metal-dependent amidase/aminoacylase/carboxypeptidase family protein